MKIVETRLVRIEDADSSWESHFDDPLFQRHFCMGIYYYEGISGHSKSSPSYVFIFSPERQDIFPQENTFPITVFLAWFDIEREDNLEGFIPMLVRSGKLNLSGMIQNFLPALQYISYGSASVGLKKIAFEKCLEASLYAVIASMLSEKESIKNIIDRAIIYMEENILNNLSLDDLSKECKVSKEHLIRIFKKEKNMTPMKYFTNMRLKKSMDMISDGKKIHQIVIEMNFYNDSYFCKQFKNYFGFTPSSFKKENEK